MIEIEEAISDKDNAIHGRRREATRNRDETHESDTGGQRNRRLGASARHFCPHGGKVDDVSGIGKIMVDTYLARASIRLLGCCRCRFVDGMK